MTLFCVESEMAMLSEEGSSKPGSYKSPFSTIFRGEEHIVSGVLELDLTTAGDGQDFPTRERYRVLDLVHR